MTEDIKEVKSLLDKQQQQYTAEHSAIISGVDVSNKVNLIEKDIATIQSSGKMLTYVLPLLFAITMGATGFAWNAHGEISVLKNQVNKLEMRDEKLADYDAYLKRVIDNSYHEDDAKYVTKEIFAVFKDATNVEILDRKNYSLENQRKIDELSKEVRTKN